MNKFNIYFSFASAVLKNLRLSLAAMAIAASVSSCTGKPASLVPVPFEDLYYYSGTPPLTRLCKADVEIQIEKTPNKLKFGIGKNDAELTSYEAEKALGAPESFSGAQFCTQEDQTNLGLPTKPVQTFKFNLHTRDNRHYSLLFLGSAKKLQFWRLMRDKNTEPANDFLTGWNSMATTASFAKYAKVVEESETTELVPMNAPSNEDFLKGRSNYFHGYDSAK